MDAVIQRAIATGAREIELRAAQFTFPVVRIPAGEFLMGSTPSEVGRQDNEPLRRVRLTKPFYMGKYQVTQAQFQEIMGYNPSPRPDRSLAVDEVMYAAGREFCRRLTAHVNAPVTLPTEAQWEYACRAGTQARFYTGDSDADLARAAWYRGNSGERVHAPGQKEPNAWGLYDMLGNLWEFCSDFHPAPDSTPVVDLVGDQSESRGGMRGGCWIDEPNSCRAARRSVSNDRFGAAGIRIVLNV